MISGIDVAAERAATPGCDSVAHLNYAGAGLPTAATLATVVDYLGHEARRGGYEAEAEAADRLAAVRASAARLLAAPGDDVVLTGSDTDAWTRALWGLALGGLLGPGTRILVDRAAYDSHVMGILQVAKVTGATVDVVPSTVTGELDLDALHHELSRGGVGLASFTHVGTHRGLINPVEEAGAMAKAAGSLVAIDACQSLGQLPVDVGRMHCDLLTGTGRKWIRGPRGTGLLYVAAELAERMVPIGIDGRSAIWSAADHYDLRPGLQRFVPFETPVALRLGLGTAIDHILDLGIDVIATYVERVATDLRSRLTSLDGVEVHDGGERQSGIVTFTVAGQDPWQLVAVASTAGINVSATAAAAARLDMGGQRPDAVVRASPHYLTTTEELDRLTEVVAAVAGHERRRS